MSGNDQLLSDARNALSNSDSGIASGSGLLGTSSSNVDDGPQDECCETSDESTLADRPVDPMSGGKYPITIHHLDFGYNVKVGCQNFAVETVEKLIKNLEAYLNDPRGTEIKWMRNKELL